MEIRDITLANYRAKIKACTIAHEAYLKAFMPDEANKALEQLAFWKEAYANYKFNIV